MKSKIIILLSVLLITLSSFWINYHFKDLEKARKIKEKSDADMKADLYIAELWRKAYLNPKSEFDPIIYPNDVSLEAYVSLKQGVDVREYFPSLNSKITSHLGYLERIHVFDTLDFFVYEDIDKQEKKIKIKNDWARISGNYNVERSGPSVIIGFVPKSALGFGEPPKTITPYNIYDFEYLYINKQEVSIDEEYRYKSIDEESRCETLKKHLRLELVDLEKYKSRKIASPYAIDTSNNYKYMRTIHYPKLNTFYVKIKDGKDSVKMKDSKGEYNTYTDYIGEIPFFKFHVIRYSCLEDDYLFLDKYTGKKIDFSAGFPFISPDKKHILAVSTSYENGEDYWRIYKINENLKTKEVISVSFKNWGFDENPESAFWISNNEIILKVCADKYLDKITYEYIKLTIL